MRVKTAFLLGIMIAFLAPAFSETDVSEAPVEAAAELNIPTLDDFLERPDFFSVQLSPSGRYISGIERRGEENYLSIIDLHNGGALEHNHLLGNVYIDWAEWITEDRLILSVTGYINYKNGRPMTRADLKTIDRDEWPIPYTRLLAMDRDATKPAVMFAGDRVMRQNISLSRVISFLPDDPDHILMSARRDGDLDLFKLNVQDGTSTLIARGTNRTYAWYVDKDGEPAFRYNTNKRATVIFIHAREDRANGKIKWRHVKTIHVNDNESDETASEFTPLYVGPTSTSYYVAARPEGEDKVGIYLYDFEQDEYIETIKVHPEVDIGDGRFNRETRELQAILYYEDRLQQEYKDPEIQVHMDGLNEFFDHKANVYPTMSNRDGTVWLVQAIGPLDSGSYYVYDVAKADLKFVAHHRSTLGGKTLSDTSVIRYTAQDGKPLRGYLTRPASAKAGDTPPLIMLPHGGPEARDVITFDWAVQLLASRGYQVFQPNFRGSSGFGKAFADEGRGQWGKLMQTDVDDGFDYLVQQGYAKADRACIYGASYGGYVALVAATLYPEKYHCAIAVAAPGDLIKMLSWERKEVGWASDTYAYWKEHIGDPRKQKREIMAVSPKEHVQNVSKPLLLIHGKEDGIVPYKQMEYMADALEKAGKPFDMVTLEDSAHSYRSDEDERKEYEAILAFLDKHLPVE